VSLTINDKFCQTKPSHQNAIDIFEGIWITSFSGMSDAVTGGTIPLESDQRITEMISHLGGNLAGMELIELGPFECGHTKMLHDAGASKITAVEGNSLCYLKSLIAKEIFDLDRLKLKYGEIESWLTDLNESVDLLVASGVLYHFKDPLAAILNMTRVSNRVFIWTHYFDELTMPASDPRRSPFTGKTEARKIGNHNGTYHFRGYNGAENNDTFCGGMDDYSVWVEKRDIFAVFEEQGFSVQEFQTSPDHLNGPCACFLATK
jgi:hypothetical protein